MFNVTHLIQSGGLYILALFLFAEVGLFLGFFLPGDTLLIAAGIYAMQGKMNLIAVIIVGAIAASAGDSTSFWIGRKIGRKIFQKEDNILFDPKHIKRADQFYEKYGNKTILIAHFLPIIRTFNPLVAGVAKLKYKKYLVLDLIGDSAWAIVITLVGYYIGSRIPNVDHYILIVVALVVALSAGPTIIHLTLRHIKIRNKNKKIDSN
ncbi:MAG: DedA family protein [Patescibacteria group bacterium]|jgi:Uncharacterized membrane-associated protein|nr:DedA family protein [Patescibacteria group bacterium]